jgi:hypothetical protein
MEKGSKLNRLLKAWPLGTVSLTSWLVERGISTRLLNRYKKSHWLETLGWGAWIRSEDKVGYEGAIYALQQQAGLKIHPGGKKALVLLGKAHYLELSARRLVLFGAEEEKLPSWFGKHDWGLGVDYYSSSFLPADIGLTRLDVGPFSIEVSGAERAIMECLYLVPEKQDMMECYRMMEGLNTLRPNLTQKLLEACTSVKVKRLFLYLAEKIDHGWTDHLDLQKINIGSGNRTLIKGGVLIPKYQITVPRELENIGKTVLD